MKRIISALLVLVIMICSLGLTSCGKNDGAPDGMQLVMGGDNLGYYFYGPEEWVVANVGNIGCTYASKVDLSSMTFVETEKPEGSVSDYFESEKAKFPYEISVSANGEDCLFGNATGTAKKYIYTYTYKDISYTCMQIFVENSGRFFIFTYTANNTDYSDDKTYYPEHYIIASPNDEDLRNHPFLGPNLLPDRPALPTYWQVFSERTPFEPNLSILDYLFNEGR